MVRPDSGTDIPSCELGHGDLTPVQDLAYTGLILSRVRAAIPPEPASFIARALHRRLPDRIRGAGTLYLWLRRGRTALKVARKLTASGRTHEFIDTCARIPLGAGDVQLCTADLCQALSEAEGHDTRALFVPGDGVPELPVRVHWDPAFARAVGMLPLTGTTDDAHMRHNLDISDFTLTGGEIETMLALGGPR